MNASKVKYSGGKTFPHSDLRGGKLEKSHHNEQRIGTWNVRTLLQSGKLENLLMEMERMELDVLGVAEMRWPQPGDFWSGNYRIIHSGTADDRPGYGGVGIVLNKKLGNRVKGFVQYNERLISVRIETKPRDTVIVQVYMPTTDEEDEAVEKCYEDINELIGKLKSEENLIVLGDWNATVGEGAEGNTVGKYGLGQRNARGEKLIEFCSQYKLVVTNTIFQHHPRRRYTWKAPGDVRRAQIDYILVRERYKNQVKNSRSYPGADVNSDHNLVMMHCELKFKALKMRKSKQWDMTRLKDDLTQTKHVEKTNRTMEETEKQMGVEQEWNKIKKSIELSAEEVLGRKKQENRKEWISQDIVEMINERQKYKNSQDEEGLRKYRSLRNKIIRKAKQDKEEYLREICKNINNCMKTGQMDIAYREVKRFFETRKVRIMSIVDKNGELKYDSESIAKRWKEYLEQLYCGEDNENLHLESEDHRSIKVIIKGVCLGLVF
ncbi:craniofacial development protein 2-like [Nilaparvata lugens]|uniref:craniofacial development protein 2-like n=1 Tax=Nilaparvata lugens TaxID=108931 RepID=UPI00193D6B29|nr:craniofacial development protein 2-like [Nilaparvata lugens]